MGFSEIDKYAITSYCAIHNIDKRYNLGDVSKVNIEGIPECDLITYGFPCQDISIAGHQKGIVKGKTRSGLLYEALRVIEGKKPKYAIAENVKNLVGKKFKHDFDSLLRELGELGYNSYWKVLNAKNFGIAQNRERVFVISIRKDVDDGRFEFPRGFDNGLRLKDFLEDEVGEKYYIENEKASKLLDDLKNKELLNGEKFGIDCTINNPKERAISNCITSRQDRGISNRKQEGTAVVEPMICAKRGRYNKDGKIKQQLEMQESGNSNALTTVQKDNLVLEQIVCEQRTDEGLRLFKNNVCGTIKTIDAGGDKRIIEKANELNQIGTIDGKGYESKRRVYKDDGISPTLHDLGSTTPNIATKIPNELQLFTNLSGGKWDRIHESARRVYDDKGISPTIPTCGGGNIEPKVQTHYRIRKLTPRECYRLMGFSDEDFNRARQALISAHYNGRDRANSQLYKQAGNSIVVDVLIHIYKNLFNDYIK